MKKVVLLAAVICGLCSCIKNETVLPSSEQYREIALKPFNSKSAMRAPIDGTTLPDDARLGVFAFYNGATPQKYFEDAIFGKKAGTDNTWAGITAAGASRPYYWPTSGSLDFFAYYPKHDGVGVQVNYSTTAGKVTGILGFTGIAIDISSSQYDLMYSDMLLNRDSKTAEVGGIPLTLHHALTQIVVNIKKTDATPKVVVTKVTVNNVFLKADGFHCSYYDDGVDNTIKKAYVFWNWNTPAENITPAFAIPNVQADTTTAAGKEGVEITTTSKQFGDGALIIPYPYMGGNHQKWECQTSLTIEYTFDNGGVESEVVHTIDLNKGITDVNAKARWEMAKKYTYNITIGLNQIEFEPTVDNWDDAAGKDINL